MLTCSVMEPELEVRRKREFARRRERYLSDPVYRAKTLAAGLKYRERNRSKQNLREKLRREGEQREAILAAKREWSRSQDSSKRKAYFNDPAIKARKAEYDRRRRAEQGDRIKAQHLDWRKKNQSKINAYWRQQRCKNPQYAIGNNLRCRINAALRAVGLKRDQPLEKLIGCTMPELIKHIEKLFLPGMTWQNRGHHGTSVWHIDHRRPCASFDLTDPAQQAECFHFTNLQPLWAVDNIRKGDTWAA